MAQLECMSHARRAQVWKLLLCSENVKNSHEGICGVLDNHCCQKDAISDICLDVERYQVHAVVFS
jgi:hypothetical protein